MCPVHFSAPGALDAWRFRLGRVFVGAHRMTLRRRSRSDAEADGTQITGLGFLAGFGARADGTRVSPVTPKPRMHMTTVKARNLLSRRYLCRVSPFSIERALIPLFSYESRSTSLCAVLSGGRNPRRLEGFMRPEESSERVGAVS